MSIPAKASNWCTFDATAKPIDETIDPTPPAAAILLANVNAVVQGVAVTPYVGTGHLCYRHGYAAGAATSAVKLYYTMAIAPGAAHAKFCSSDRMDNSATVSPAVHSLTTTTSGAGAADVAVLPMLAPAGFPTGNSPNFWDGKQVVVESANNIDDAPVASVNRMLEMPSFRHPVLEHASCTAVMAWSCRVVHQVSDLASL